MTIIIGVVARRVAQQVGDRLVVKNRSATGWVPHDILSNKQLVVVTPDALVAIGYAGLAYFGNLPTDSILAEAILGTPFGGRGIRIGSTQIPPIFDVSNRIARCLTSKITPAMPAGVDVAIIGLKQGKRNRIEPLVWKIRKAPNTDVSVERLEETPFHWGRSFMLHCIGDIDHDEIDYAHHEIRNLDKPGPALEEAIGRLLVKTVRNTAKKKPTTVGNDCMAIRLRRERNKSIAEVEYRPIVRANISIGRAGGLTFPEAYSPWFLSSGFVFSPSVVKGDGGWDMGNVEFRIRAPQSGDGIFFGSQERQLPPT